MDQFPPSHRAFDPVYPWLDLCLPDATHKNCLFIRKPCELSIGNPAAPCGRTSHTAAVDVIVVVMADAFCHFSLRLWGFSQQTPLCLPTLLRLLNNSGRCDVIVFCSPFPSGPRQVSVDVEGDIYSLAGRSGITLFTVSHRKSLWKHHSVS